MTSTSSIQHVCIHDIQEKLNRLKENQREKIDGHACLFNLVVYSDTEEHANRLRELVQIIIRKFPCRILFITRNELEESDYLDLSVSTLQSGQDNARITCEQIDISVGENQLSRVPFIILPNLVPDLPVYLLWAKPPMFDNMIFPHLSPLADRILFDSDAIQDLHTFSAKLCDMIKQLAVDIADLNWVRLFAWRAVLSQIFHDSASLSHLKNAKTVTIAYNLQTNKSLYHPEMQAIYLAGWLGFQMQWKFHKISKNKDGNEKGWHLTLFNGDDSSKEITVSLVPQKQDDSPIGAILAIEVTSYSDHHYLAFKKPSQSKVEIHVSSANQCELPNTLALPHPEQSSDFLKQLLYCEDCNTYKNILHFLSSTHLDLHYE